ncbi:MAG: nucleotidyltransferase family protein [Kiritimatiellales bacterium]|nr:nucleotidyltransferase family protein [Kiritimatiellales bacterium]MCF7864862.1 nucleotidyltransferase family protein [Kiritimatiellales bacterium]
MGAVSRVNAILLAGDRRASIKVKDDNKAFLPFHGVPLFIHVLRALQQSRAVRDIVVVGPADRVEATLREHASLLVGDGEIRALEQRENMVENFKAGYVASLGLGEDVSFWDLKGTFHENVPVLVAPCDIPLLTPAEVDEFVVCSNMHEYDYAIGITSKRVLSHYRSTEAQPGIQMIYFHVKEDLLRHNNLHLGKPLSFDHLDYIEKMYEWRYQTRLANILRMFFSLLFSGWRLMKGLRIFILMQLSLYYDRHGHPRLADRIRSLVSFNRLADGVGNTIGARIQLVYTHFGGAALDADNARDLSVMEERYDEWMEYQASLAD